MYHRAQTANAMESVGHLMPEGLIAFVHVLGFKVRVLVMFYYID